MTTNLNMATATHQQHILAPTIQHPGERLAQYFDNFFKIIVAVSTLGLSLTFSKVISSPVEPWVDHGFSKFAIQNFLAIAWLLFVLDLAITSFAASALSLYRPQAVVYFGTTDSRNRRTVAWYASAVSATLFGLLIAAFVFLSLAVTALVGKIGLAALGFTVLFGLLGLGTVVWQSPIGSKSPEDDGIQQGRNGGTYYHDRLQSRRRHGSTVPILEGTGFEYENGRPRVHYAEDKLNERSTFTRPVPDFVPHYTADMRRNRASRVYEDELYPDKDARAENRYATGNVLDILTYNDKESSVEKDLSSQSNGEDHRWPPEMPAAIMQERYESYGKYKSRQ